MFEKRLRTFNKNKKLLLSFAGYKSIQEAKKFNVGMTDVEIYSGLLEDYNQEVDLIKEEIKKTEPQFVRKVLLDKVKFFSKFNFFYKNVDNLEKFYKAIQDALKRFPTATSISIYIKDKVSGNKVRAVSLTRSDLYSFSDFEEAINRLITGNDASGSDAINLDENEIILDTFGLASSVIAGNSSSATMMFNVVGITETVKQVGKKLIKSNDCGKLSLLKIFNNSVASYADVSFVRNLEGMITFIKENKLPVNIISNAFTLNRPHNEIVEENMIDVFYRKNKPKIKERLPIEYLVKRKGTRLTDKDIEIVYLYDCGAKNTIIYDEFEKHFDVIDGEIKLQEIYLTAECYIIKKIGNDNTPIFKPKQMNKANKVIKHVDLKYVFFDYETVIDFEYSSCMKEYSLSILVLTNEELEILTQADIDKDYDKVSAIRKEKCITFLGYDCSRKFIDWIIENQVDTTFIFVGFNNANFDNFIFLHALLSNDVSEMERYDVANIFYNGTQLLNFFINGRHNTFDIHKHLMGSLKANCDSFKINCCAKKSFDHNKAQQLYMNKKLIEFITDNDELKEYNEYDVLATSVLFCKYRRALSVIDATEKFSDDLHNIKTVGSLIFKVFEESKRTKNFKLSQLNLKEYTDLQNSKIAGRVELFNGIQKVEERIVSTDVCSLYPYVMSVAPVYYPCGDKIYTDVYVEDKIGFYYCDIDQSNLRDVNLPKIYAKKTKIENDWGHEEVLEDYLISNVMIDLLKKYGCKVVIKKGFYFTDKMKSCEMFDFLLDFMKAKNCEDTKKKEKDNTYNSALRETLKLLMNSLSGKVIEGLHTEKTKNVESVSDYIHILERTKKVNTINAIGNKIFITYEMHEEDLIKKQRPIYLGVLIYDYAKSYMYENSYSKVGLNELLYTDTDASKFKYSKFIKWKREIDEKNIQVPHWTEVELVDERYKDHKIYESDSKVFGSFEDELEEMTGKDYKFYCVQKKSWAYVVDGKSKFRFKGLNDSALLLSLGEDFVGQKIIKHSDGTTTEKHIITGKEEDVYNFAISNKHLSLGNNVEKFFEQLFSTGEAYMLCNSFRKIVKNMLQKVFYDEEKRYNKLMNKIQVNYSLKHIKI